MLERPCCSGVGAAGRAWRRPIDQPAAHVAVTFRPTTGYEDVKMVALARLAAPNVPSIQVDWRRYGPKLAQVALTFGADDVDGVSPSDDAPGRTAPRRWRRFSATSRLRGCCQSSVTAGSISCDRGQLLQLQLPTSQVRRRRVEHVTWELECGS